MRPADPDATKLFTPQRTAEGQLTAESGASVSPNEKSVVPSPRLQVAVAEGAGASPSNAVERLRQSRLRAAALFLAVTAVSFVVYALIVGDPLWPMHVVLAVAQAIMFVQLSPRRVVSPFWLRVLEFTIFGLAAAQLAVMQFYWSLHFVEGHDAMGLLRVNKSSLIITTILMFAYAMLIPNSWRVAAAGTLALVLIPVVTEWVTFLACPKAVRFAFQEGIIGEQHFDLFLMLIAAGLAVYGAHVLNTLRQEVFEARRLNQYQLREPLGAGGMGEVHLVEHRLLKRLCALKLIHPESAGNSIALARFEREVRAAARLSHPNIVEIYDYGYTDDGTFYYVMEYLRGLSLEELVERHGPLPAGRVIYLLGQACAALAEAHAAGLVHRDLKPANVFAAHIGQRYDVAKILDFGLVKEVGGKHAGLSTPGAVAGTPLFMAPEQAMGSSTLDHRADLYALGGIAYYLLTGRPPFEEESAFAVMMAHARDPVTPPTQHFPSLPGDLEQIVLRCLAKEPADRYPDAEALGQALAACSAAAEWDGHQAALWWQGVEQGAKTNLET